MPVRLWMQQLQRSVDELLVVILAEVGKQFLVNFTTGNLQFIVKMELLRGEMKLVLAKSMSMLIFVEFVNSTFFQISKFLH